MFLKVIRSVHTIIIPVVVSMIFLPAFFEMAVETIDLIEKDRSRGKRHRIMGPDLQRPGVVSKCLQVIGYLLVDGFYLVIPSRLDHQSLGYRDIPVGWRLRRDPQQARFPRDEEIW